MATLIDTFLVAFESDTRKLQDGTRQAEQAIEDTTRTVRDADRATSDLGESFFKTIKSARSTIVSLLSIGAITRSVISQAASTEAIGEFSRAINANIADVDAWGRAVANEGGSAEGFQSSLMSLTGAMTELSLTGAGPAAETFARLGIQAVDASGRVRSAFSILPDIADSFQRIGKTEALALGQQLGLDQGTILLLQKGRKNIRELVEEQKRLSGISQESYRSADMFRDQVRNLTTAFEGITRDIGTMVLPMLTSFLNGIQRLVMYFRENQDFVVGFFGAVAAAITYVYLPAAISAIATTVALTAPFIATGAAIAAVAVAVGLLYDDFMKFANGAPSVIGDIAASFGLNFQGITDTINHLWQTIEGFLDYILSVLSGGFDSALSAFSGLFDSFSLPFFADDTEAQAEQKERRMVSAIAHPVATQSINSQSSINRSTSIAVGNVNVDARGGDSKEISSHIGQALRDEMQAAVSNFDDAVVI